MISDIVSPLGWFYSLYSCHDFWHSVTWTGFLVVHPHTSCDAAITTINSEIFRRLSVPAEHPVKTFATWPIRSNLDSLWLIVWSRFGASLMYQTRQRENIKTHSCVLKPTAAVQSSSYVSRGHNTHWVWMTAAQCAAVNLKARVPQQWEKSVLCDYRQETCIVAVHPWRSRPCCCKLAVVIQEHVVCWHVTVITSDNPSSAV